MILETAVFSIYPGQAEQFRAAFAEGRQFVETSKGFQKLEMRQGIEAPDSFILVVWWQTLEDHTIVFKQSDNFTKWRAVVGHFFAHPPVVNHFRDET